MKRVTLAVVALLLATAVSVSYGAIGAANNAPTMAQPVTQTDLLQVLPDSSGVIVVDVQRVLTSNLFSQEKLQGLLAKAQNEVSQLGFQMSDVQTAAVAFPTAKLSDPTVAVSGTFNQTDILARLRDNSKVKLTSEKYKNADVHIVTETGKTETGKTSSMAFTFVDASTVVAGPVASVRNSIDVRGGEKPSLRANAKLMDGLTQSASSAIRFALNVTPEMTKGLESSGLPLPSFSTINLIFGGIEMSNNITLNATLRNNTADSARILAEQLNSLFAMVKGLLGGSNDPKMGPIADALKTISIVNTDVDVKITGAVPAELIGQLIR